MTESLRRRSVLRPHLAALAIAGLSAAIPVWAGDGVININQHRVPNPGATCNEPPFDIINSNAIDVNSYHVDERTARFDCAREFDRRSRPIVISDDAPIPNGDEDVLFTYIGEICSDAAANGGAARGREHFEHYQADLEKELEDGETVNLYTHFPGTSPTTSCSAPDTSFTTDAKGILHWMRCKWGPSGVEGTNCAGTTPSGGGSPAPFIKNGTLGMTFGNDRSRRIAWNERPATLVGYGAMGAAVAAADGRVDPEGYFRVLRYHGFNLTRAWILDQWVGQAICDNPANGDAPTPFGRKSTGYDIEPNDDSDFESKYFNRLRNFVQAAADRGVVVQLSLFDKWGLVGSDQPSGVNQCRGGLFDSPYWDDNNEQNYLISPDCECGSFDPTTECTDNVTHSREDAETGQPLAGCPNNAHVGFLPQGDPSNLGPDAPLWIHSALVRRTVEEVGGIGNVMFEIVNEARKNEGGGVGDWVDEPDLDGIGDWNETWQDAMARVARQHLPIWIGRDAFNETDRSLAGQSADAGGQSWSSSPTTNARIWSVVDQQASGSMNTGLRIGFAAAPDPATSTTLAGFLPIPSSATSGGNLMTIRADLKRVNGELAVGFEDTSGNRVYVEVRAAGANQHQVRLFKRVSGVTTQLAQSTVNDVDDASEANIWLRLRDGSPNSQASVRLDGGPVPGMSNLGVGFAMTPARGYFLGTKSSGMYQRTDGEVDNFEISASCDDPVACGVPALADGFETCNFDGWNSFADSGGNTLVPNSTSPIQGVCDLKAVVGGGASSNSVYVQYDHLGTLDSKVRIRATIDLSAITVPLNAPGEQTAFRFMMLSDTTYGAGHKVFFASRAAAPDKWNLTVWTYDVGASTYLLAGTAQLSAYPATVPVQFECTWTADTNASTTTGNGTLACSTPSGSFQTSTVNDRGGSLTNGVRMDVVRLGFLENGGNFAGSGNARFDDIEILPLP